MGNLRQTAADLGLPFGEQKIIYNSRLSQELGLWCESQDKGDAFHIAAFRAYFVEGKNIAKIPVLVELAASIGLSRKEASSICTTRAFKAEVDADWSLSKEKAITAVPTFVMDHDKLVGAQPYKKLEGFIKAHGVKKRNKKWTFTFY